MNDSQEDSLADLFQQVPKLQASPALWARIERDLTAPSSVRLAAKTPPAVLPWHWRESLLSMAATLVILALPTFSPFASNLATPTARVANQAGSPSIAIALAKPASESEELAFDEETWTWLASLGEVGMEEAY